MMIATRARSTNIIHQANITAPNITAVAVNITAAAVNTTAAAASTIAVESVSAAVTTGKVRARKRPKGTEVHTLGKTLDQRLKKIKINTHGCIGVI